MSELPPNIRKFLDDARSAHDPSTAAPARVWSELGGRLGVPLPPLPPLPPVAPVPPVPPPPPVAKSLPPPPPPAPVSTLTQTAGVGTKLAAKTALAKLVSSALLVVAGGTAVGTYDRVVAHTDAPVASVAAAASVSTPVTPARGPVPPVVAAETAAPVASSTPSSSATLPDTEPASAPDDTPAPPALTARSSTRPSTHGSSLSASARDWDGLAGLTATSVDAGEAPGNAGPAALTTPNAGTLSGELTLLRDAEAALGRGDATKALAATDEHARLYPSGTLRQERMATRALALCALQRNAEARSIAVTLAGEAPRSPYADRLRVSCAGWPTR